MTSGSKRPPRWIKSFLSNFLDQRLLEGSLGDLEEKYNMNIENGRPVWRANVSYIIEALGFIKLASTKKDEASSTFGHLVHSLIFFTRLVRKDKSYYIVSMFGLALSLTSFLLITMYVVDELSYDKIHENRDRTFRVATHVKVSDVDFDLATSQFPAADALLSEFPEIEEAVRIHKTTRNFFIEDKQFNEDVIFADEGFLDIFSFSLLYGDRESVLKTPGNVVLSKDAAIRLFGSENAVGQQLRMDEVTVKVVGVMENIGTHSHLKFDILMPLSTQLNIWKNESGLEGRENKWFWIGAYTYLLLREPGDEIALAEKMPAFVKKYFPPRFANSRYELQRLTDIHLSSHKDSELEPNGDMLYVRLFSALALVILLVSSINLVNLSYFKISSRIREVGIRKFLGQNSRRVVSQLAIESLLAGVISFVIALVLCHLFLGQFNLVVDKDIRLWTSTNIRVIGFALLLVIVVSVASIARPAMRFATRSSSLLLLSDYRNARSTGRIRNILIGLQVCFSFVLLVFSFIVSSQIDFFKQKDLGFDRSNVIIVGLIDEVDHSAFRIEVKKNAAVIDVTESETPSYGYSGWRFVPEGGSYEKPIMLPFTFSDENFLATMKIKLLSGRNFSVPSKEDTVWSFLLNKRAAIELGWTEDALGRRLEVFEPGRTEIMAKGEVIGIIDDYHSESLHDPVKPVVITFSSFSGSLLVRVNEVNGETISSIESTWKKFSHAPFRYTVLDQQLDGLYSNERKLGNVMLFFTFVALYLTCYGMFAMSSLLFSSKLKEVAIRKVFGAGEGSIMGHFYGRYALFNLVALIFALPIAIWLGDLWLETFPYRVKLSAMFFLKAAALILAAGIISVSYYLAKVAWANPLSFLRRD